MGLNRGAAEPQPKEEMQPQRRGDADFGELSRAETDAEKKENDFEF